MKYIKSITEFQIVNEGFNLKKAWGDWKGYLITLGLIYGISQYTNIKTMLGGKLNDSEISKIVNDIKYRPEGDKKILVDNIKKDLIDHIRNSKLVNVSKKDFIINSINNIKISILPKRYMSGMDIDNSIGVHFHYINYENGAIENAIVLNGDYFNYSLFSNNDYDVQRSTIIHELWHMIDNAIAKSDKDKFIKYSDVIDLYSFLDKDIVTDTPEGKIKLEKKLNDFINIIATKNRERNKKNGKKNNSTEKNNIMRSEILDELKSFVMGNVKYMSSPAEVYARFHGLKQYLVDKKYIKSTNDPITKKDILKVLNDESLIDDTINQKVDFFQLIFYMNIDISGKENSESDNITIKNINSIVANYNDFDKTKRDV